MIFTSAEADSPLWKIYFTNPSEKKISTSNPEYGLIRLIKSSRRTFFCALYDLSSQKIANELIKASERGVDVRVVTESDNYRGAAVKKLINSHIPVIPDSASGLMHNKFAISDGSYVFTGSYNTTDNGSGKNNNNAIVIKSEELADIYLSEFQEMFGGNIFGNKQERGAFAMLGKKYYASVEGTHINAYFSPEDSIEKIICRRIEKARSSVCFMCFSFTSDKIGEAMIKKFKEGVDIRGIFEKRGAYTKYSEFLKMKIEGVPVIVDRNRYIMHHKVIIIDNETVITGSFNFSENANKRNDENILIIQNREAAKQYKQEFNRLYSRR